jgi:hypothetical protein
LGSFGDYMSVGNLEVVNGLNCNMQGITACGRVGYTGIDTSGTPGDATANYPAGISAIASGQTTCVITNSLVNAYSGVSVTFMGDHGSTRHWVTRVSGSFTVHLASAAAANTSFTWTVADISSLWDGATHYWNLNGGSTDVFGTGNGTDTAVTYTTPKLGSACAAFNGTTSKIVTAVNGPTGTNPWSMACWLNHAGGDSQTIWQFGAEGTGVSAQLIIYASQVQVYNEATSAAIAVPGTGWHHWVVTYDGTTLLGYKDAGTPVTLGVTINVTAGLIRMGMRGSDIWALNGLIDDTCMWDRALTAGEVTTLYNSGAGLETMSGSLLTNLIHQWHLNGSSVDNVGSANGTDTAVTYGGKLGQAAMFNGTTSKIVTATPGPLGAAPRSMACWFKQNSAVASKMWLGYGIQSYGQSFEFYTSDGVSAQVNTWGSAPTFGTYTAGVWNHFVVTYDGTTLRGWVNGVKGTDAVVGALNTAAGNIHVGSGCVGTYNWNGLIDEVGIWNRALTQAEVTQLYNAGSGWRPY